MRPAIGSGMIIDLNTTRRVANLFDQTGYKNWIKLPLINTNREIFCPVQSYLESGQHEFHFPVFVRVNQSDKVDSVDLKVFAELIHAELSKEADLTVTLEFSQFLDKIQNSEGIINQLVDYRTSNGTLDISEPIQDFIKNEQSLLLGHNMHPFGKGRLGWNSDELIAYSPETQNGFQVHYFLGTPAILNQTETYSEISQELKSELVSNPSLNTEIKEQLISNQEMLLLPVHPWEAKQLLATDEVKELIESDYLVSLGELGEAFQATSSVRTVYSPTSPYMFKFSLHVQITNSERVNAEWELERGYRFHKLLKSEWGTLLADNYPTFSTIDDPAYFQVKYQNQAIAGFNTIIRQNPFRNENASKKASLIASLTQGGINGEASRMERILSEYAEFHNYSVEAATSKWFDKYLDLLLGNLLGIFNELGLVLEAHQQNVLLEIGADGAPEHLYYRDNQGYFFRAGKAEFLCSFMPELANEEWALIPEDFIYPKFTYYLMVNNILGVVSSITKTGFISELELLKQVDQKLIELQETDQTELIDHIRNSRDWTIKANMLTKLADMDEVLQPMDNPAVYKDMPNPLLKLRFQEEYLRPKHTKYIVERTFEDGVDIKIRPFDLAQDLPLVHGWFNEEHAKAFWKMDGSIKDLEKFYIELLSGDAGTAYVGEINGVPNFTYEPYWSMTDETGRYYHALPDDHGTHLFIAPTENGIKYKYHACKSFITHYFQTKGTGRFIGEADASNKPIHAVALKMGFEFHGIMELPHKKANLTICTRESYLQKFPDEQVNSLSLTND